AFTYDPTVLQPVAAYTTGFTSDFTLVPNLAIAGEVYLALFNSQPLSGSGDVVWVTFAAVGAAGTGTDLTWQYANLNEGSIPSTATDGRVDIVVADTTLGLPDCASGPTGGSAWVPVLAAPADGFTDVDLTLAYDTSLLQATAVRTTPLSTGCGETDVIDAATGRVDITLTCATPLVGTGAIAEVSFDVLGFLGDDTPLDLVQGVVNGGAVSANIDDGLFIVGTDADLDGVTIVCGDCDDGDPDVYPGAPEICDGQDNQCPGDVGYGEIDEGPDTDGDGVSDCFDGCPADPLKTDPGICGCGVSDVDSDGDTTVDCLDADDDNDGVDDLADCAPLVNSVWDLPGELGDSVRLGPTKYELTWDNMLQANVFDVYRGTRAGASAFFYDHTCHATEVPDTRHVDPELPGPAETFYYLVGGRNSCADGHGSLGSGAFGERPLDVPCPAIGADLDSDGVDDIDDNCPLSPNPAQADGDLDGLGDACDTCPLVHDPSNRDSDGDMVGDACDDCTDTDGDGFGDPGFPGTCTTDNCPDVPNADQADADSDGIGDLCDPCPADPANDADGDGVCGDVDNCPLQSNLDQADFDGDGLGDLCDDCTDVDGDGFGDPGFPASTCPDDDCPLDFDPAQADGDGDGVGNVCDDCPADPDPAQLDGDGDGVGDACDPCPGNPDPGCVACADPATDPDGDGVCDEETVAVTEGTAMRYLANLSDPGIGTDWVDAAFSVASWPVGSYGVGYDDDGQAVDLIATPVPSGTASVYTRATFEVADAAAIQRALMECDWDDGYLVWINGDEVFRSPELAAAGAVDWNTAAESHESSNGSAPDFGTPEVVATAPLVDGTNTLAIGVWNRATDSTDLVLVPRLTLQTSVDNCPQTPNPGQEDTDGDGIGDACDPS
ncbi:MAG: thrombospondin type 3 repeat-containing protein, partial [Candidatus Eiseniibacteriota bacterium]